MKFEILKNLNLDITKEIKDKLELWERLFLEYNSHTNLMSKNDVNVLFEKHVYDSLAINLWDDFKNCDSVLDVGTGGGFPGLLLAMCFQNKKIRVNDSRIKKINFITEVKKKLNLENLEIIYSRIEDVKALNTNLIVSRAVGKIIDIYEISKKHLAKNGKFLIYKSKSAYEEIEEFKKKYKNAEFQIIPYKLPLSENFERNLVIML